MSCLPERMELICKFEIQIYVIFTHQEIRYTLIFLTMMFYSTKDGGDVLTIVAPSEDNMLIQDDNFIENLQFSPTHRKKAPGTEGGAFPYDGEDLPPNATFLRRAEKGGHMIESDADFAQLRMVAGQLCIDWNKKEFAPAIARRICDFQFAQEKRRKKFGNERPWGILGLYDHLSAVRMDVEWAEVAACRRANGEP